MIKISIGSPNTQTRYVPVAYCQNRPSTTLLVIEYNIIRSAFTFTPRGPEKTREDPKRHKKDPKRHPKIVFKIQIVTLINSVQSLASYKEKPLYRMKIVQ